MATDKEVRDLASLAARLIDRIDSLTDGTGKQLVGLAKAGRTNRRLLLVLWTGFILDIVLTVAMAVGLTSLNNLAGDVQETQQTTKSEVLCPLYQQFVNADTPKARELAAKSGQDMQARDAAFKAIRQAYNALDCSTP